MALLTTPKLNTTDTPVSDRSCLRLGGRSSGTLRASRFDSRRSEPEFNCHNSGSAQPPRRAIASRTNDARDWTAALGKGLGRGQWLLRARRQTPGRVCDRQRQNLLRPGLRNRRDAPGWRRAPRRRRSFRISALCGIFTIREMYAEPMTNRCHLSEHTSWLLSSAWGLA